MIDADHLIALARDFVGAGHTGPRADDYHAICYPTDSPEHARRMGAGQSSCALFVTGLWYRLGLRHHLLDSPYWGDLSSKYATRNDAMSRLEQIAREHGAWHHADEARDELPPAEGCAIIIGSDTDKSYGGPGHVLLCTYASIGGYCESIDGGQVYTRGRDTVEWGGYGITRRVRVWRKSGRDWWLHGADHPHSVDFPGPGRRLYGWVDWG